jgi:hypothetical protein
VGDHAVAKNKSDNGGVNKSAAIREVLSQNPHSPTQEVVATLSGKGIKVLPSLVYFIKGKLKQKQRKAIGKRMAKAGVANPVDLILRVRSLASEAGGMGKLKQLVDALSE